MEPFGNQAPFAEPSWNGGLASPYYNQSHRKLAQFVRGYLEEHVLDHVVQWEEAGAVPQREKLRFVQTGFSSRDIPAEYAGGSVMTAGIDPKGTLLDAI